MKSPVHWPGFLDDPSAALETTSYLWRASIVPKYSYIQFQVMCYDAAYFRLDHMRAAVEYLKRQPQTGHTGLIAQANVVDVRFKLFAQPMIQLKDIAGKTPRQLWSMFDSEVDRQVYGLRERYSSGYGNQC